MMSRRSATHAVLVSALVLLMGALPATSGTINEIEPNDTFGTAQVIPGGTFTLEFDANIFNSTTAPHATILASPNSTFANNDYYRFTTLSAGVIQLDIDSAPTNTNYDTELHLWNAAGTVLASNDDFGGDAGDTPAVNVGGAFNSRILTGVLPAGDYIVGVSAFSSSPNAGGTITGSVTPAGGTYTLHISADAASVPAPAALALIGVGLLGAAVAAWRRRA